MEAGRNKRMVSSKPIINQVLRSLRVPPGMTYALVEDIERKLWVVESCPAGTHFWTLEQAAELPQGPRTHRALSEILNLGRETMRLNQRAVVRVPTAAPLRPVAEQSRERSGSRRQRIESARPLMPSRCLIEA